MKFSALIFIFIVGIDRASAQEMPKFKPQDWTTGFHLLVGGGVNASIYRSNIERQNQGGGLNFRTDFGYYFKKAWAIEAGSNVKFNRVKEYFIWDTLLTIGVRHRFLDRHYARLFYGQAPTVFYLDDAPDFYKRQGASRVQYLGAVYGLAYGEFLETKKELVWFWEVGTSYQELAKARGIRNQGAVPEVVFTSGTSSVQVYSLYFSVGMLVF